MAKTVSFENDIAPIFKQFAGQMRWRLDLTNYAEVQANAELIYQYIQYPSPQMPPAPFPPLTEQQVSDFAWWKDNGFPR